MEQETLAQRVERGAATMDGIEPGWAALIQRPINQASVNRCVVAQVYGGNFFDYRVQVAIAIDPTVNSGPTFMEREENIHRVLYAHGFYAYPPKAMLRDDDTIEALNGAWEAAVAARRT